MIGKSWKLSTKDIDGFLKAILAIAVTYIASILYPVKVTEGN